MIFSLGFKFEILANKIPFLSEIKVFYQNPFSRLLNPFHYLNVR